MRVISGTAGRRRLNSLKGQDTRPTADRVKESLFNILQGRIIGAYVLDLFAGSGALGIEALSRGSDLAVFIEKNPAATDVIKSNLQIVSFKDNSEIYETDALKFLEVVKKQFDIIFIDPPYMSALYEIIFDSILKNNVLTPSGVISVEYKTGVKPVLPSYFKIITDKKYGNVSILIAKQKEDDNETSCLSR